MLKFEWTKKHTTVLLYTCGTILLAIAIVLALLFPSVITGFAGDLFDAVSPVFIGFVIAYLISPVCEFFEHKVFKRLGDKKRGRVLSVVCAMLVAFAVIGLFIGMMVPQVVESYLEFQKKLEGYLSSAVEKVSSVILAIKENDTYGFMSSFLSTDQMLSSVDSILDKAAGFVGNIANTALQYSSRILVIVGNIIISVIFAIYFLIEKERIFSWISKLSGAIFPKKFNVSAKRWISFTDDVFSSFISGKIVNALIITVLNFIVFGIAGIPYYPLIALVTGVTDMIPYFGPFIGAIPCAFIVLIAAPHKVIWFAILVLVIQQIDGNIVGPKILGEKVGVDSLLIIVAITVSGGLFGIIGMFVGVPVFTVLYSAIMEMVSAKLKKKGLPSSTEAYVKTEKEATK